MRFPDDQRYGNGKTDALRQNGRIFFIERDVSLLSRDGRPLSVGADLNEMYAKRLPMYQKFADFTVKNASEVSLCADEIIRIFNGGCYK